MEDFELDVPPLDDIDRRSRNWCSLNAREPFSFVSATLDFLDAFPLLKTPGPPGGFGATCMSISMDFRIPLNHFRTVSRDLPTFEALKPCINERPAGSFCFDFSSVAAVLLRLSAVLSFLDFEVHSSPFSDSRMPLTMAFFNRLLSRRSSSPSGKI